MDFDLSKRHCFYFDQICRIPHGSYHEAALSAWIDSLARENGFRTVRDEMGNLVVYVPATPGYEDHPGVIVQAHMDMVCEKTGDSRHDFERDPLELYVEGTHLRARGTTLGADDGMGVAYMLDIMTDRELKHPYLELCFTVQEEVGLYGANALKAEYFSARRLINLDGAGEFRTYVSLAGARNLLIRRNARKEKTDLPGYRLSVSGLRGGRTGDDIGKERANAWNLCTRVLHALMKAGIPLQVADLEGPGKSRGIPSEACAVFVSPAAEQAVLDAVRTEARTLCGQYDQSDPDIRIEAGRAEAESAFSAGASADIVKLLLLLPIGVMAYYPMFGHLPSWSANLGKAVSDGDGVTVSYAVRSPFESCFDEGEQAARILAEACGASVSTESEYYGYRYIQDSPFLEIMDRVFREVYGKELIHEAAHGGNECGAFKHLFPDMDIVTSGAIYGSIHTPDEYLDLESFDRSIVFLKRFLSEL